MTTNDHRSNYRRFRSTTLNNNRRAIAQGRKPWCGIVTAADFDARIKADLDAAGLAHTPENFVAATADHVEMSGENADS